jgi:hypothetical protein
MGFLTKKQRKRIRLAPTTEKYNKAILSAEFTLGRRLTKKDLLL